MIQGQAYFIHLWNPKPEHMRNNIMVTSWNQIARRNINNLKYADDTTLMAESEEEVKSLLMEWKEESEKVGLKLNILKTKNIRSGPITA